MHCSISSKSYSGILEEMVVFCKHPPSLDTLISLSKAFDLCQFSSSESVQALALGKSKERDQGAGRVAQEAGGHPQIQPFAVAGECRSLPNTNPGTL